MYEWISMGFVLVIEFIEHLHTQLITTSNYNNLTCLQILNITATAAHIKFYMSLLVIFW
jgi:hypothetical protein